MVSRSEPFWSGLDKPRIETRRAVRGNSRLQDSLLQCDPGHFVEHLAYGFPTRPRCQQSSTRRCLLGHRHDSRCVPLKPSRAPPPRAGETTRPPSKGLVQLFLSHWMRLEKNMKDFNLFEIKIHTISLNLYRLRAKWTNPNRTTGSWVWTAPGTTGRCTRQKHGTPTASRATEYTRLWCILGCITKFTENFEKIYTYSFHSTLTTYKILRSNSLYFSGISVLLAHEICIRSSYIVAYLACNNK